MQPDILKQVAVIGDHLIEGEIKGVALIFHGLGCMQPGPYSTAELEWAKQGWLLVSPFYGPWSWMNRQARAFVDEVVDSVYQHYGLSDNVPLVSTGGSMGGCSALLYARYAKRPIQKCLALYPVCDIEYHYNERPDLPRSMHHAFRGYGEDLKSVFKEQSPIAQIENMPDIPYLIVHGDADLAVNKKHHSDLMVKKMVEYSMNVEYIELKGYGHGGALYINTLIKLVDFVCKN